MTPMVQMQLQVRNVKQTNLQSAVSSVPGDQHSAEFLPGPASCKWRRAEHETDVRKISNSFLWKSWISTISILYPSPWHTSEYLPLEILTFWKPDTIFLSSERFSTSQCCNAALILSSILKRITRKNREEQSKTWHKLNRLLGINVKCYVSCLRNLLTMTIFLKLRDGRNIYLYIESRT